MGRFLRVCRWLGLVLVFLLVLGAGLLAYYTHTDGFREFARQKLLAAINDSVQGKIGVARLDGSIWGSLALVDVSLADKDGEILRIPRLKVSYALLPLIWGRIQVLRLEAEQPAVRLSEASNGSWNIVEALSPVEPQSSSSSLVVSISSVVVQKGDVEINFSGSLYRLAGCDLEGTAEVRPEITKIELRKVSSRFLTHGIPEANVAGALAYQDREGRGTLQFSNLSIASGGSALRLTGKIDDLETFQTEAKVSIDKLAPADIAQFVPQWPVKAVVSGTADLQGPLKALKGDLSLSVADGALSGRFQADVASGAPVYRGRIKIAQVNLAKLLERKELRGIVNALVEVNGKGFSLANIAANGDADIRSAAVAEWNLGDVSLKAGLAHSEAKLAGQFKSEVGRADWDGAIVLTDVPRYELNFAANQLDIQKLSAQQPIKGSLNLTGFVKGAGLSLAEMNTLAKIDVQRSTLGAVELEQGTLVATIANQRISVAQATLKAADAMLSLKGDIGTDLKQQGRLEYQITAKSLSPWLALIDREGSGSIHLTGAAKGNLDDLKAQGKLTVSSINYAGSALGGGTIDYDLGYANVRPLPYGTLNVALSDIRAGYRLQSVQGVIKSLAQTPATFELDLKARDAQSRTHTVAGRLDYQPAHLTAKLTRLTLDMPDGTWRLAQPVTVEQREQDFLVERLTMRNNGRELFLDGRFSLTGSQALRLNVEKLPIEGLRSFFPDAPDITGILSTQVELGGTAALPQLVAALKLENSKLAGYSYAGLTASGSYRDQKAEVKATLQQDPSHTLSATALLPLTLSWNNGWRAEFADNVDARIQSSALSLAFLNAFSGKTVQGIAGEVEVDLQARGSLSQPSANGFIRLRDGKLTPTALGVQITSITAEALLEPRGIRISQLAARSNKGELNGSGFIALQKFVPQGIDINIAAKGWPAINTQQYQIEVDGAAKIDGTLTAPQITGKFEVPRGELRPDLSFLDRSNTPVKRDPTITVVSTTAGGKSATKPESNGQGDSELWRSTRIDIQIRIPNNLWIRHRNGNAELSGNLRVIKASGGNSTVTGFIETIRGWVGFQGRRFTLTQGRLEFGGGEKIDPSLDIVAEYQAGNYLISAVVKGTAEKPTLTLASNPQLDQADILSVLLFNKPLSSLEKSEQASLQQNAISITAGFAAAQIGQAVSQTLGFQELGVDITNVSVSRDVSGKYGQQVSAEYRITSEWRFSVSASTVGPDGVDLIWQKRY